MVNICNPWLLNYRPCPYMHEGSTKTFRETAKKILSNHYKSIMIIDKRKSSILKFKDEKIFFFLIERVVFPVMMVAVLIVTCFDIYLYWKYHSSYNDKTFLYFFPIPYVAPSMFAVNFVMSVVTATKIFYWDEPNEHSAKLEVPNICFSHFTIWEYLSILSWLLDSNSFTGLS